MAQMTMDQTSLSPKNFRTVILAALVTITDAVLAYPFAYFMARVASRRTQRFLFAAVLLPLSMPGVVAGSIFTFSLTLGDYITPTLIGGAGSSFLGNVIFDNIGVSNNLPFAAALAMVPIAIMAVYLFVAARLGAFEAL